MPNKLIKDSELHLYGTVGGDLTFDEEGIKTTGFTDEQVIEALGELSGDIVVRLNSSGGIAFQGIAIYNSLKAYDGKVTVYVDAVAASAASVIAMAGDTIIMRPGSLIMIHNPATITIGTSEDHRKAASTLDEVAAAAAEIYAARSGRPLKEVLELMAAETWMRGAVARTLGFADDVEDAGETMCAPAFKYSLFKHAPDGLLNNRDGAEPRIHEATASLKKEVVMTTPAAVVTTTANPAAVTAQISAKDTTQDIFTRCRSAKLTMEETEKVIMEAKGSGDVARDLIINMLADRSGPETISHSPATVTADGGDKFVTGVTKALLLKSSLEGGEANEFSGMTMREIARYSLEVRGIKKAFSDPMVMIGAAMQPMLSGGMHTTSDFVNILANIANKSMLRGYSEVDENFDQWTARGILTDFKPGTRVDTGLFPNLDKVIEGAEYKSATMSDRGETIQLATYGKLFPISRQAIINDDIGAFSRVPQKMGRAAKRTVGNLVYAILTANPNLSDGVALFHASHNNLLTGAGITAAAVSLARAAMAKQKDADSHAVGGLNIRPRFLMVPVELEDEANVLMASEFDPSKTQRVPNSARNAATVISDARLSEASAAAWYMSADPGTVDTIEVAYLNGVDTPMLEQREGWGIDGVEFKVRLDAGVKALDFRGLVKNPGA
jgi:ATP-dependent protease ClpP protease subunit/phage major head subunit gpT-like protein